MSFATQTLQRSGSTYGYVDQLSAPKYAQEQVPPTKYAQDYTPFSLQLGGQQAVNNDLTGNTLIDESANGQLSAYVPALVPGQMQTHVLGQVNVPESSYAMDKTLSTAPFDDVWQQQQQQEGSTATSDGRRLSISEYNFDNANYYEYEDLGQQQQQQQQRPLTSRQLDLTEHVMDLNLDEVPQALDIDVLAPGAAAAPSQQSPAARKRVRDYFRLGIFGSGAGPSTTSPEDNAALLQDSVESPATATTTPPQQQAQLNDQFTLKKMSSSSFWNPQFLKRSSSGNNSRRAKVAPEYPGDDTSVPFNMPAALQQVKQSPQSHKSSPQRAAGRMFKHCLNPMVVLAANGEEVIYTISGPGDSLDADMPMDMDMDIDMDMDMDLGMDIDIDGNSTLSPIMTIAPSLVTNDDTSIEASVSMQPSKSMNPFMQQDTIDFYNIANSQLPDDLVDVPVNVEQHSVQTPVKVEQSAPAPEPTVKLESPATPTPTPTPTIKRKFPNMPKTRGRKPSLIPDASKQFCCEYCDRRFKRQEHLKRHVRSLHICEKPFTCHICHKHFSRSDNLNQHIKTHAHDDAE
ncbi:Com2 protein [Maudiozyma humilis]|uniref:Com2 protein n=1 Tax=Maudiozyma humilis TaxID=51915 RepID=A0AAV5RTF6_MAUHU|nr:Com2 protein [Kazachstania humilis]